MEPRADSSPQSPGQGTDLALAAACGLAPAIVATAHLGLSSESARDTAVIRTVGLGFSGWARALDGWVAAPFALFPVGTRPLRAALPGVILIAILGALQYATTRRLLAALCPSAWNMLVAAVSTATFTVSYPVQHEAVSAGSSLLGVVLVQLLLILSIEAAARLPMVAAVVVLTLTYDPLTGLCGLFAVAVGLWLDRATSARPPLAAGRIVHAVLAGAMGLVPFALNRMRSQVTPLASGRFNLTSGLEERGIRHLATALRGELGEVLLFVALAGLVWGLVSRRALAHLLPVLAVTALAAGLVAVFGGATDDAWSPAGLLVLSGVTMLASIAMQEAVIRVAGARLPLASASAALVVVLEMTFPAMALDDALQRLVARPRNALGTWEDSAFAGLSPGDLILANRPSLYTRIVASKAAGTLPGDIQLLPLFDPTTEAAAAALSHDPELVSLFRDLALAGSPQELSLSTLATQRPLTVAADPSWDRSLTRHLVPSGLLSTFEAEPRGGADRKRALEAFQPVRVRLVAALGKKPEGHLTALTGALLLDRALLAAAMGEREVLVRANDDVQAIVPKNPRLAKLVQREAAGRGPVDVHDLLGEPRAMP